MPGSACSPAVAAFTAAACAPPALIVSWLLQLRSVGSRHTRSCTLPARLSCYGSLPGCLLPRSTPSNARVPHKLQCQLQAPIPSPPLRHRAATPPPRTVARVAALGLGLCRPPRTRARVDLLRLADDEAVLHQLAHVLPCRRERERGGGGPRARGAGRRAGGGKRRGLAWRSTLRLPVVAVAPRWVSMSFAATEQ